MEDWWPSDPRLRVTVAFRGVRWRLHRGRHQAPLDLVESILDMTASIDHECYEHFGFRAGDLLEIGLRYINAAVEHMNAAWPAGDRGGPPLDVQAQLRPTSFGDQVRAVPARVSSQEIRAARRWWAADRLAAAAAESTDLAAARRALVWATAPAPAALPDPADPVREQLGPYLGVAADGRRWAFPASLMLAQLQDCVLDLAATVGTDRTDRKLRDIARNKVHTLLYAARPHQIPEEPSAPAGRSPLAGDSPIEPRQTAPVEGQEGSGAEWDARDPHMLLLLLLLLGRRLITVDVVPTAQLGRAEQLLTRAHAAAFARSPETLLQQLGFKPRPGLIPIRVLLTHGLVDVTPVHTGGFVVIPLGVLRQVLRDADDDDAGRDLAWQFLEDICSLPSQIDQIAPAAMEDIWSYWRYFGGLLPPSTGVDGAHALLVVAPTLYDPLWTRAAELEPVVALADTVGLPDLTLMPSVHVEGMGRATVWGPMASTAVALGAPSVVVAADSDAPGSIAQADAAMSAALITSLRDALATSGLGEAMAGAEGCYRLSVVLQETLTSGDASGTFPAQLSGHPENGWELVLTFDVLRRLVLTPRDVHVAVGRWLAEPLLHRPGVHAALERWMELPPFLTLDSYRQPVEPPVAGQWMHPTGASHNRAARAVAAAIASADRLPLGRHTGAIALHFCKQVLLPAAVRALHQQADRFDGPSTLAAVVYAADAAHAERARRRRAVQIGLTTAQADLVRERVMSRPDDALLTRAAELLVEEVLAQVPGEGAARPDRFDVADLTAVTQLVLEAGVGGDLATRNMGTVTVIAGHDGGLLLEIRAAAFERAEGSDGETGATFTEPEATDAGHHVDTQAWFAARRAARLTDPEPPEIVDPADGATGDTEHVFRAMLTGAHLPSRLRSLDQVMRTDLGWGLDSMVAVMATTAGYSGRALPQYDPETIVADAVAYSGQPRVELAAAVDFLTLRAAEVQQNPRFWEQERRPHRLFLRPLVASPTGKLLIPRHLIRALQEVMADMLGEGRLVWSGLPESVVIAANDFRQQLTTALERRAVDAVTKVGLSHRANLEQHEAAAAGVAGLPGEIDLLVADEGSATLWVIEVKDHIDSVSPYSIEKRVDRFLKIGKGYLPKLQAKVSVIGRHADEAAGIAIGHPVPQPEGGWKVRPLMVTRRMEPAAFVTGRTSAVPFVLVSDLAAYLTGHEQSYGATGQVSGRRLPLAPTPPR